MSPESLFHDRVDAGRQLARELSGYRASAPLVLGLPRGGVPVASEIARALGAELDVCLARKLGAPGWPELGMGAVADGDEVYLDPKIVRRVHASDAAVQALISEELAEIADRQQLYRGGRGMPDVGGRTVIVVDDGIATGGTARAALRAIRKLGPTRLVLAVPVGAADTLSDLREEADEVVCPHPLEELWSVGLWYEDFSPVSDEAVIAALEAAARRRRGAAESAAAELAGARGNAVDRPVSIALRDVTLSGDLAMPERARGLVVFVHGSGSSRKSPRNRFVAGILRRAGLGTLLFDLLTELEEEIDSVDAHLRFDIGLLSRRLGATLDWVRAQPELAKLPLGLFGASTGAAAALVAAAKRSDVGAVVSRGGRPDLAKSSLEGVRAPTLLVVGGADPEVLALNRLALRPMRCAKRLEVVQGATHLFAEPGTLEEVARLAADWFDANLARPVVLAEAGA